MYIWSWKDNSIKYIRNGVIQNRKLYSLWYRAHSTEPWLVTGGTKQLPQVWNVADGRLEAEFDSERHEVEAAESSAWVGDLVAVWVWKDGVSRVGTWDWARDVLTLEKQAGRVAPSLTAEPWPVISNGEQSVLLDLSWVHVPAARRTVWTHRSGAVRVLQGGPHHDVSPVRERLLRSNETSTIRNAFDSENGRYVILTSSSGRITWIDLESNGSQTASANTVPEGADAVGVLTDTQGQPWLVTVGQEEAVSQSSIVMREHTVQFLAVLSGRVESLRIRGLPMETTLASRQGGLGLLQFVGLDDGEDSLIQHQYQLIRIDGKPVPHEATMTVPASHAVSLLPEDGFMAVVGAGDAYVYDWRRGERVAETVVQAQGASHEPQILVDEAGVICISDGSPRFFGHEKFDRYFCAWDWISGRISTRSVFEGDAVWWGTRCGFSLRSPEGRSESPVNAVVGTSGSRWLVQVARGGWLSVWRSGAPLPVAEAGLGGQVLTAWAYGESIWAVTQRDGLVQIRVEEPGDPVEETSEPMEGTA